MGGNFEFVFSGHKPALFLTSSSCISFSRGSVRYVEEFIQAEYCNLHFDTHVFDFKSIGKNTD